VVALPSPTAALREPVTAAPLFAPADFATADLVRALPSQRQAAPKRLPRQEHSRDAPDKFEST
jgi:hypothetical protein